MTAPNGPPSRRSMLCRLSSMARRMKASWGSGASGGRVGAGGRGGGAGSWEATRSGKDGERTVVGVRPPHQAGGRAAAPTSPPRGGGEVGPLRSRSRDRQGQPDLPRPRRGGERSPTPRSLAGGGGGLDA